MPQIPDRFPDACNFGWPSGCLEFWTFQIGLHTVLSDGYGCTKNGSRMVMNHCPPSVFFFPYTLNGYGTVTVTAVVQSCTVDGMQYLYIHYFVPINQWIHWVSAARCVPQAVVRVHRVTVRNASEVCAQKKKKKLVDQLLIHKRHSNTYCLLLAQMLLRLKENIWPYVNLILWLVGTI